jgi:long-chain fatty acid transport protein
MKTPTTALLIAAALPTTVFALGFRLTDQDTVATARGGAFVATADNPSAIYYNPAGITQLSGTRSLMSIYTIGYGASIEPTGSDREFDSKWNPGVVPHSFYTLQPKDSQLTLGLGFYSPFGLGFEYDNNTPFRTSAIKGELQYIAASPVAAWKFNYSRAFLSNGIVTARDEFKFKGTGVGFGFVAGILYQPTPRHSFGLTYHSSSNHEFSGHTNVHIPNFKVAVPGVGSVAVPGTDFEDDADAMLTFPQTIQVGYSFRPTSDWNFEFDIEWTDWNELNTVTIHQSKGADLKIPFNYRSSFLYDFGVTRKFANGMHVSAGYIYAENSVPNEFTTPLVPDSDRHVFSVGVGGLLGKKFTWDIAYQYAYGPHRHISNGTLASGDYHFQSNAVSISLGHEF